MAFLKKFFQAAKKQNWLDQDLTSRQSEISTIADTDKLLSIIDQDKDKQVLRVAVRKITDAAQLDQLCQHENALVRTQAKQQRLAQLLTNAEQISSISNSAELERIAELTEDNELRLTAISQISDQAKRLNIVLTSPVAKVRLAAAQGISEEEKLQQIMQFAQNKDKALYRACKQQLSEAKQQQKAINDQQQAVQNLIDNSQQLANQAYGPDYNGRLQLMKKQLTQVNADTEQQSQIEKNLATAQAVVDANAEQERQLQQQIEDQQNAELKQVEILNQLNELIVGNLPSDLAEQLKQLEQNWQQANQTKRADKTDLKQFENNLQSLMMASNTLSHIEQQQAELDELLAAVKQSSGLNKLKQLQKQIQQNQKTFAWPNIQSPAPKQVAQLANAAVEVKEKLDQLFTNEKSALATLTEQLKEFEQAIKDGQSKLAGKLQSKLQQQFKNVSQQKSKSLFNQFRSLQAELREIRDWQGFAATPKKQSLCEEMEALINSNLAPALLADKIHDLQEQWKSLGQAENEKELWQRFQQAQEQAYQPCRDHFDDIAKQRQLNLAQRQQLTAQLISYEQQMDWSNADWKAVQKTLDTARDAFYQYAPVDRAQHKSSQAEFKQACDAIYQHLKDQYDENIQRKEAIINRVEKLAELEDLEQAIEQTKQQQAQWKEVGITPHKAEQALWKKLRAASDAVFARRNEQKAQHKAEIQQQIDQAESLVQEAEQLAGNTDAANQQLLKEKQQAFADIFLPKGVHQKLRQRLNKAVDQQADLIQQAEQQKLQQKWHNLVAALNAKAAQQEIELNDLPAEIDNQLFKQSGELNTDQLRTCCITMELIADVESPAQDQAARMEFQVKRLANNMGQGKTAKDELLEVLPVWLNSGADGVWQQRFNQSLSKLIEQF